MDAPSGEITHLLKGWGGGDQVALERLAPRQAKVVELRYFGGLTEEEIVAVLKISPRTARRDWDLAKAWLLRELRPTIKTIGATAMSPGRFRRIEELYHAAHEASAVDLS